MRNPDSNAHEKQPSKHISSKVKSQSTSNKQYTYIHRFQKKSNIFIFTIYFSQFLGKFYETFREYL